MRPVGGDLGGVSRKGVGTSMIDRTQMGVESHAQANADTQMASFWSPPDSAGQEIRLAIMCNGHSLEQWQALCVEQLLRLDYVRLVLLIVDDGRWAQSRSIWMTPFDQWLYTLYRRTWFMRAPRRWMDIRQTFAAVPRIHPQIKTEGKYWQYFDDESLEQIRTYDLSFVLRFGFNIIRGPILTAARHGVWSFHHGDEMKYRGSPAGFWEIYNGDPVTAAVLQRLTNRLDAGIVLKRGYFKTINYSYIRQIENLYNATASWPAEVCRDIFGGNADYLAATPSQTTAPIYHPPDNAKLLRFFAKTAWRVLWRGCK